MANNKVKHYRTDVAGRKPEAKNMLDGEIAINLADKKIFTKFGDAVINIGNGTDAVVEGGQTFTGKIKASDIESDSNLTLKNLDKSDIVFADEHDKAKARISSPAQTDSKGELRITVAKGKATGESSDFVLNGNGQLSLPAAPVAPDSATRKDYVDSEISKVQTGSSADLTKLEQKVDANDAAINTRVDNLNSKVDQNDTAINTKVDANKADADEKIKAVNDRLTVDNQTLKDMIDTKVNKAGDTMTGDLTVPSVHAAGNVYAGTLKVTPAGNNGDVLSIENHGRTSKTIHQIAYATDTDDRLLFRRDANEGTDALDLMTMTWGKTGRGMSIDISGQARITDAVTTPLMSVASNFAVGNSLGLNSIAIGDSDTGFKWREDGWLNFYSNNVVTASIAGSENYFNRKTHFRFRSDDGDSNLMAPEGYSLINIDTTTDGNNIGDATTYFGLVNGGKYNHYLRGSGRTYIDTKEGLGVAGPASFYKTIYNNKPYGWYDSESLPDWNTPEQQSNHLRKVRAVGAGSIYHELAMANHPDDRLDNSICWFHGDTPEYWMGSLNTNGRLNLASGVSVNGESNAIQLNIPASNQASYMSGNMDGRNNTWILGKTSENLDIVWSQNMRNDFSTSSGVTLRTNGSVTVQTGTNTAMDIQHNTIQIDGARWAATNDHAYANQWRQNAPMQINFGAVAGESDYYPGYSMNSVSVGHGFSTVVELGTIRGPANSWGKGILRVGTKEESTFGKMANYEFDIDGRFAVPGKINTPSVETNRLTSFGINTDNVLGGNSIAFGDNDTGIRQVTDGNLSIFTNGIQIATFNTAGLTIDRSITINTHNESRGVYVGNVRTGASNAMIQGVVDGWPQWSAWRDRPAGMIVEAQTRDKCINIWKHVHWGTEYGAAMDIYNPGSSAPEAALHIGGADYLFLGNGTANAIQWVSTSDKRLKSNFEEIENAVDKVEKLTGYVYDKKSDLVKTEYSFEVREAGIIAQELKEVLPEAVSSFGPDEILGVNSAAVNALLVNAIKELSARVKELEAK